MTCSGGAQVKSGISPTTQILVDRSLWETVTGAPSSWFDWLLDIFVPQTIKASDLCALNLADPPLPSAGDIASALLRDPSSILNLYNFVRDKLRYAAFANTCECIGTVGCAGVWPTSKTFTFFGAAGSTFELGTRFTVLQSGLSCNGAFTWFGESFAPMGITLWDVATGANLHGETFALINNGYQQVDFVTPQPLTSGHQYELSFGLPLGRGNYSDASGTPPSGSPKASWDGHYFAGGSTFPNTVSGGWPPIMPQVCGTTVTPPTAVTVPTQPADLPLPPAWSCTSIADVCVRLQQLSEKLDWLIRGLPIPQSSSVAQSTAHSGLSGTGSISVTGIVGLRVDLTAVPTSYARNPGTPTRYSRVGRVDVSTGTGWQSRRYLTDTPLEWVGLDPTTSTVGYSLAPGVVATITELVRGP